MASFHPASDSSSSQAKKQILRTGDSYRSKSDEDPNEMETTTVDGIPIRKLFVGNLAQRTTPKDLCSLFAPYGVVESCYIRRNNGRNNFAFVTFKNVFGAAKARKAAEALCVRMHCRILRVSAADSWHQPDDIDNQRKWVENNQNDSTPTTTMAVVNARDAVESPVYLLDDDCLTQMFLYLPISDRIRMERVCKRWQALSRESWWSVRRLDLQNKSWGLSERFKLSFIDTAILRKVLMRCGDFLTTLDLSNAPHNLSSSTLTVVSRLCTNLQCFDITGLVLSPSGIRSLTRNCQNINEISIKKLSGPGEIDLSQLFTLNKKLKSVSIADDNIIGKSLKCLPSNSIEKIKLDCCTSLLSNHFDSAIIKFTIIQSLELNHCVCLNNNSIMALSNMITLKNLSITGNYPLTTANILCYLSRLINLEQLDLSKNTLVNDNNLMSITSYCEKLKILNISGCYAVTNKGIFSISTLPKLEIFSMNSVIKVSDESISSLANLKVLRCRSCSRINDSGIIKLIEVAKNLEELDLSGTSITNSTIDSAIVLTKRRQNNKILKIVTGGTKIVMSEITEVSPLLQLINVDLS